MFNKGRLQRIFMRIAPLCQRAHQSIGRVFFWRLVWALNRKTVHP
ncbi:hypothetical protein BMETH_783_0 [methanotrophic bacterial endosymbiont of Bathymodiolus sp.]|nr:hypothetical protein BMETH_783_0 [methanotrophic bacterial endosymbiont of Bathymodiolus sp.]